MTAEIIDGKAFAEDLRARVAAVVPAFAARKGRPPGLAVVLVGEDPASRVYVRAKSKATLAAGMASFEHLLPATPPKATCSACSTRLGRDEKVDGILVQLPLPPQIDERKVIAAIDPAKDVDGFHVDQCRPARGRRGGRPGALHAARLPACCSGTGSATLPGSRRS